MSSMIKNQAKEQRPTDNAVEDDSISPEVYSHFLKTNEGIMRDEVTMQGFRTAIELNAHLFRGAVVLEVGCGSALLSMWAARQGALRVIAVEQSPAALVARQLVRQNRLEHVIDVQQCSIDRITLPTGLKHVDIIISKWMGACLLYSSIIEDVIYARDTWLKPGGSIFPYSAKLYLVAAEQPGRPPELSQFWARFAGLNLSHVWRVMLQVPTVTNVDTAQLCSQRHLLRRFDMRTLKRADLSFVAPFKLLVMRQCIAHWFVAYFDFSFTGGPYGKVHRVTSSPKGPSTQWKHTIFQIDAHLPLLIGDELRGKFKVERSPLHLDFDIEWDCRNKLVAIERHKQIFRMQGDAEAI